MGTTDKEAAAKQLNTTRKDFTLYSGGGLGGGGSLTVAGTRRTATFIDISKYDVYIRQATIQNASFGVYSDALGANRMPLYFGLSNSNDYPTTEIIANASAANGLLFTSAPPYDVNFTDLGSPFAGLNATVNSNSVAVDGSFFYDQGRYLYSRPGLVGTTFGNNNKLVQSFTPSSDKILNIAFSSLFLASAITKSDPTQRDNLVIEVWDPNKNVIFSETISKLVPTTTGSVSSLYPYNWTRVDSWTSTVASDGIEYWDTLRGYKVQPSAPLIVSPGQVHYVCVKQESNHAANTYAVGDNTNSTTTSTTGFAPQQAAYPNGELYFAPYASTVLTRQYPTLDGAAMRFVTTRDIGRFCLNVAWDSSAYYWYNPATVLDQFKVTRLDSDRRI